MANKPRPVAKILTKAHQRATRKVTSETHKIMINAIIAEYNIPKGGVLGKVNEKYKSRVTLIRPGLRSPRGSIIVKSSPIPLDVFVARLRSLAKRKKSGKAPIVKSRVKRGSTRVVKGAFGGKIPKRNDVTVWKQDKSGGSNRAIKRLYTASVSAMYRQIGTPLFLRGTKALYVKFLRIEERKLLRKPV